MTAIPVLPPVAQPPCVALLIETDGPGGAERVIATLSSELLERGFRVVVVLPAGREGWLSRELGGLGVTVERFCLDTPVSMALVQQLGNLLRRHHVAVAHSHEFTMAVYGAVAARLAGCAHVITMHGSTYCTERLRRRLAMRLAVALSHATTSVSRCLEGRLRDNLCLPAWKAQMIANGIHPHAVRSRTIRAELGLRGSDRLIVTVGNLYPVKGHRFLIDAVGQLARAPRLHVAIAGRGHLADALANQARQLTNGARVHMLGLRSDIGDVLAAADVFALPSLSEGLPMALLEAMHSGVPIVATDVGDVAIALDHGRAGLLVSPGNVRDLSDAIRRALTEPGTAARLAHAARLRATQHYGASLMADRYVALYEDALAGATSSIRP